jgi:uncharacterized protein
MTTILEQFTQLVIGTVESVSTNEITALLDNDAPQVTALNTGSPTGFPRINGYVLIPNETGAVVGLINWIGIERSKYPKQSGLKEYGVIDLPFPSRKMTLTPVGNLVLNIGVDSKIEYELFRGVNVLPSVGDSVLLPTNEQLHSIIELKGMDKRVCLGKAPLANGANVFVNPDKLFGRHLAVLGNTGGGKSCTVAGLIRWCIESAQKEIVKNKKNIPVNARYIILDPNGEYTEAFKDLNARVFKVPPEKTNLEFQVPGWMWNSEEWCACSFASSGTQRPMMLKALRDLRSGGVVSGDFLRRVNININGYKIMLTGIIAKGPPGYSGEFVVRKSIGNLIENIAKQAESYANDKDCDDVNIKDQLNGLFKISSGIITKNQFTFSNGTQIGYNDFTEIQLSAIVEGLKTITEALPKINTMGIANEDAPIRFDLADLAPYLEMIAPYYGVEQYMTGLKTRIELMLADRRMSPIINPDKETTLEEWLNSYIGKDGAENGQIAIIDLSLVPSDVLHVVVAILGRIVFEAVQRYRKLFKEELPTVLVLEEAHSFIKEDKSDNQSINMCRQVFERIAREGRKFGLGLVVSSQRPSEISPTVLAQCNTFILHRIVNDRDQNMVAKLVPDNLGMLLGELPNLPTREAILLGWAVPIPILVEINELDEKYQPHSSDPQFWSVWTGEKERKIKWNEVVSDWCGIEKEEKEKTSKKTIEPPKAITPKKAATAKKVEDK